MPFKEIDVEMLYNNDSKLEKEDVKRFMQWADSQPHLPKITELQAMYFLHSCFYKQEAAKNAMDTYFTVRTLCPDIFMARTFKDPLVKVAAENTLITALPKRTPEGHCVMFGIICPNPEHFNLQKHMKLLDALIMCDIHQNGPSDGLQIVVDLQYVIFAHFIKLSANALALKKFFFLLQEGLPVRFKNLHFINIVPFMDKILALIRPLLKKEMVDSLVIHKGVDTIFDYIPQEVFPKEYGGTAESVKVLKEQTLARIVECEGLINFQDSQVVVESKRPGVPKNINTIFGVEGSFKKLEVD